MNNDELSRFHAQEAHNILDVPKKMTESEDRYQSRLLLASVHSNMAIWFQKEAENEK